ncbi:MAG TPA: hypothetical protein VJI98_06220 [Candidatus Nanoarchaeia archaeon]|nr:hypothetical protein [Candidatus Nanoarchaeia archaeon]
MSKRSSYELKRRILQSIREKPLTYAQLERKTSTGYRSVKSNCKELEEDDFIKVEEFMHPANGQTSHKVSITSRGIEKLKKKEK